MKHTPGPWAYHSWKINGGSAFGIETADHTHGLAGIYPNGNASTLLTMEQHEANARLIAAAPDLLKCLNAATKALRSYQYGNGSSDLAESIADVCDVAIAKATGE